MSRNIKSEIDCTTPQEVKVKPNPNKRARVSLMETGTLKSDLINYVNIEILEDDDVEKVDRSTDFSHENYSNYVTLVTDNATSKQWIVFDDRYTSFPLSKGLSNIFGKSSVDTFVVIPDKHEPTVIINWNVLKDNFTKIMSIPMLATDDEDLVNFLIEYIVKENYNPGDLSKKENITPVDVFSYIIHARINDKVLYYKDADIYTSRNNFSGNSDPEKDVRMFIQRPLGQPPYIAIVLDVHVISDGTMKAKNTNHLVPIKSNYKFEELRFREATEEEVDERINENKNYLDNITLYRAYNGTGLIPDVFGPREVYVNSRVMVDAGALYFVDPDLLNGLYDSVGIFGGDDSDSNVKLKTDYVYSDKDFMSLSKYEICYDLGKKMWFIGSRNNLSDIKFRKDAFDKLQLDESKKQIIKKICSAGASSNKNIDFIDGKGGGNIFLLHGTPGTGKTLTAEAISELLEKPLYKVNISEFEGMRELEKGIEQALRYAERWDATLLIDEADVALERRDSNNIERNAIVAVFLRLIEYYTGTMFLTSNRAEQFDEAFKSRITFAIHYSKPSNEVRFHIWNNILERLDTDMSEDDIKAFAEYDINGRQIKNIINTSSFMGDGGKILKEHVQTVVDQTIEFEHFIKDRS